MNEINQVDYSISLEQIKNAFDNLEDILIKKLSNNDTTKKIVSLAQYEEAIGLLTIEKSNLEQQLSQQQKECEHWRLTCSEILNKLNLIIKTVQSLLDKENKERI